MNKRSIPAFSLSRQIQNLRPQFLASLDKVLESQQFIGGSFIQAIEQQLATYLGCKHVISCNSGTDALWIALKAMDMPENAIVLTTPFSFIASSSEIVANGAKPVFIDIEPDTLNINPVLLDSWLSSHAVLSNGTAVHCATGFPIVGIIPVNLFGQCADYTALKAIASEWNLWIIEDCAQSLGATFNGKKAGTFGTIGAISFYPTKNLGAFGDAGCCVTDNSELAEKILQLRNHGRKSNYEYLGLGINSRMDAFQAVVLSDKLPLLDGFNQRRSAIAQRYTAALAHLPFIKTPTAKVGQHVYHQYSIIVQDETGMNYRDVLEKHLADNGVQSRIFYPQSLASIPFLNTHQALATSCPVTDAVTSSILSLPMWPELEDAEVDYVIECVSSMPYNTSTIQAAHACCKARVL